MRRVAALADGVTAEAADLRARLGAAGAHSGGAPALDPVSLRLASGQARAAAGSCRVERVIKVRARAFF